MGDTGQDTAGLVAEARGLLAALRDARTACAMEAALYDYEHRSQDVLRALADALERAEGDRRIASNTATHALNRAEAAERSAVELEKLAERWGSEASALKAEVEHLRAQAREIEEAAQESVTLARSAAVAAGDRAEAAEARCRALEGARAWREARETVHADAEADETPHASAALLSALDAAPAPAREPRCRCACEAGDSPCPVHNAARWEAVSESASGKLLFRCGHCGRESVTPDKTCPAGCGVLPPEEG